MNHNFSKIYYNEIIYHDPNIYYKFVQIRCSKCDLLYNCFTRLKDLHIYKEFYHRMIKKSIFTGNNKKATFHVFQNNTLSLFSICGRKIKDSKCTLSDDEGIIKNIIK